MTETTTTSSGRPVVTAFEWVPEFARGLVRDLRVRWALEEIGQPYDSELLNARAPRPEEYLARQPFDQVPAFNDGELRIFETGAILLYLGEQDAAPAADRGRRPAGRAISWLFSALNSVEPFVTRITHYDLFHKDKPWMPDAREASLGLCRQKLKRLTDALDGKDWLAGPFSVADIAMVTVLNNLRHTDLVAGIPGARRISPARRRNARPTSARSMRSTPTSPRTRLRGERHVRQRIPDPRPGGQEGRLPGRGRKVLGDRQGLRRARAGRGVGSRRQGRPVDRLPPRGRTSPRARRWCSRGSSGPTGQPPTPARTR